uniref:Transmembrane protein n=1 Tax=Ixodes ricinus TaxID=34613 RepID=A0A6B0V3C0_IXORI
MSLKTRGFSTSTLGSLAFFCCCFSLSSSIFTFHSSLPSRPTLFSFRLAVELLEPELSCSCRRCTAERGTRDRPPGTEVLSSSVAEEACPLLRPRLPREEDRSSLASCSCRACMRRLKDSRSSVLRIFSYCLSADGSPPAKASTRAVLSRVLRLLAVDILAALFWLWLSLLSFAEVSCSVEYFFLPWIFWLILLSRFRGAVGGSWFSSISLLTLYAGRPWGISLRKVS